MKKAFTYIGIACVIAFVILFIYIRGDFVDNMGLYFRAALIVCAGVFVPKIASKQNENNSAEKDD